MPITNPSSSCPHYFQPNPVPGQPSVCRGCGAIIAVPNPQSPSRAIAAYPGVVTGAVGVTAASTGTSNQARLGQGNQRGHQFSEV